VLLTKFIIHGATQPNKSIASSYSNSHREALRQLRRPLADGALLWRGTFP
jgi:hypothetical protein